MQSTLSPKFTLELAKTVIDKLNELYQYSDESKVEYLKKWQGDSIMGFRPKSDFNIVRSDYNQFLIWETVHTIPDETLVKIAMDLGLDVPGFIPCVPQFKVDLQPKYTNAHKMFSEAWKKASTEPDTSVGLANSALESILKEILSSIDEKLYAENKSDTTTGLIKTVLKQFKIFPYHGLNDDLRSIATGLNSACTAIDNFRSRYSNFHGKAEEQELVADPIYAFFIVNSVSAIGSFLISYYEKHVRQEVLNEK